MNKHDMSGRITEVRRAGEIYDRFVAYLLDKYDTRHSTTARIQASLSSLQIDCVNKIRAGANNCVKFSSWTAK